MGKKEQVPARAIFVQGSLWVWSATSRGRPPDGGLSGVVRARRGVLFARSPLCPRRGPRSLESGRRGTPLDPRRGLRAGLSSWTRL